MGHFISIILFSQIPSGDPAIIRYSLDSLSPHFQIFLPSISPTVFYKSFSNILPRFIEDVSGTLIGSNYIFHRVVCTTDFFRVFFERTKKANEISYNVIFTPPSVVINTILYLSILSSLQISF